MTPATSPPPLHSPPADRVVTAIGRRHFATLATTSPEGKPHVAGVLYALADGALWVSTLRSSRKARNIAADPAVALSIPIRRLPVGPPSSVQFQTTAEVLSVDDPGVRALHEAGRLRAITAHGELELADGCVLRLGLPRRLLTYGLGMPLHRLLRDPLHAAGAVNLDL